jgi:hypothetical protein
MRLLVFGIALLAATAANATDFSAPLKNEKGEPVVTDGKPPQNVTIGFMISKALWNFNDPKATAEEKYKAGALAEKIGSGSKVDLTAEEIVLAKRIVGASYSPLVLKQAFDLLDPASKGAVSEPAKADRINPE